MLIAPKEVKVKKQKNLEEEKEIFQDSDNRSDKFESSGINWKKKHKIKLQFGKVPKFPLYISIQIYLCQCIYMRIKHKYKKQTLSRFLWGIKIG